MIQLKSSMLILALALLAGAGNLPHPTFADDDGGSKFRAYVGTYTSQKGEGIYRFEFDSATGHAGPVTLVAKTPNPSFLTLDPQERFLYAVNEVSDPVEGKPGETTGWLTAYRIDSRTGDLTELNRQPTGGAVACYVAVDKANRFALVANYTGGSVCSIGINPDGSLSENIHVIQHGADAAAHKRSRGHSFNFSPDERFAIAADAGLDEIFVYHFDHDTGRLTPNTPPTVATGPQTAPRHLSFHPNGKWAYNNNERNFKINSFDYDADKGVLTMRQTLTTLPDGVEEKGSTAEVLVHPSGKFAYVSNRGPDSIARYQIDAAGRLTFSGATPTAGKIPRNFRIDPTGKFLLAANEQSSSIVVFKIDPETGDLTPTGAVVEVPSPICIKFAKLPAQN